MCVCWAGGGGGGGGGMRNSYSSFSKCNLRPGGLGCEVPRQINHGADR